MLAVVVWSMVANCVHSVKVTVPLAGSCRRMGGVDGHLEQWVRFAGVLLGNEHSCFVERNAHMGLNRKIF